MRIFDALGSVLEEKVSVVKLDVVLGIGFVDEVIQGVEVNNLVLRYKQNYNIDIYQHDIARAIYLDHLHQLHVFDHANNMSLQIDYYRDTLSVMYEWIGRHKPVFSSIQRKDAFDLFMMLCESHRCYSVLLMEGSNLEFLFNYIYLRDFMDHTNLH